MYFSFFILR